MIRLFCAAAAVVSLLGLPMEAKAQSPGNVRVAMVTASVQPGTVAHGGHGTLRILVVVTPHFHINAQKPNDPDLIATAFTGKNTTDITFGSPKYPAAKTLKVSYETKPMAVYQGRTVILVPFSVSKTAASGRLTLSGGLTYQGCSATACYPPTSVPIQAVVVAK